LGPGAISGEDDIYYSSGYSATLRCMSQKGVVFEIASENFHLFEENVAAWLQFIKSAITKHKLQNKDTNFKDRMKDAVAFKLMQSH
jgi:hypothetical protein